MRRLGSCILTASVVLVASPASAAPTTAVSIANASRSGSTIQVSGTLAIGDDAATPVVVGEDGSGDATVSGLGTDFGKVTITSNPTAKTLTYGIEVFDMLPGVGQSGPAFGYTAPFQVDGANAGRFLAAGNAGASFPPSAGPFYQLCTSAGGYSCPTALTGTMGAGGITIRLPYTTGGITAGSLVEPSGILACPGLCSTLWAVLLFNNTGGDSAALAGYRVPGGVRLGIAPAGTPPSQVSTETSATVTANGAWTASLDAPAAGQHVVVARSCWGNADAPTCVEASVPLTV